MSELVLKEGQKEATELFRSFLYSETDNVFLLQGRAGTGKSFVTKYLLDVIIPEYKEKIGEFPCRHVYLTATTNKATEVLSQACEQPAATLASTLGLKVVNDFASGKAKLIPSKVRSEFDDIYNSLIIVDEASMLGQDIINYLDQYSHNCKFLFIGDSFQIAPINEQLSLIYRMKAVRTELTEIVRTESKAIKALCEQMRETVETGVFKDIHLVPNEVVHLSTPEMKEKLSEVFTDRDVSARVLAYTNKRVNEYNRYIRQEIRQLPAEFTTGDTVIVSNSCKLPSGQNVHVEQLLYVIGVHEGEQQLKFIHTLTGRVVSFPYKILKCISPLERKAWEMGADVTVLAVPVHYEPEIASNLLKAFAREKNWPHYFQLKDTFPNVRPSEATTYHKGQGSTYDIIFLDLESLGVCNKPNEVARMLYVGFSRPKTVIYLYGSLPEKYGKIV